MDLKLLADALVITLAPVLPHLVAGGTEAVKAAGKKVEAAFEENPKRHLYEQTHGKNDF